MPTPGMDRPPMPSPEISAQMGTPQTPPPGAGISGIKPMTPPGGPAPGAPNPHGFLLAQVGAIKKVLEQIASAEPTFAPFGQKAIQTLDEGVAAASTALGGHGAVSTEAAGQVPPPGPGAGSFPPLG